MTEQEKADTVRPVPVSDDVADETLRTIWDNTQKLKRRMEMAKRRGKPMPPGGLVYLNRESIWIDTAQEAVYDVAMALELHPMYVRVESDKPEGTPTITVNVPNEWSPRGLKPEDRGMVDSAVRAVIREKTFAFERRLKTRMEAYDGA